MNSLVRKSIMAILCISHAIGAFCATEKADVAKQKGDSKKSKYDNFVFRTDPTMERWRDHNYGQFVTFGLFSVLGGEWNGKQSRGAAEWIGAGIKRDAYRSLLPKFNPTADLKEWGKLFKRNGAKTVLITAKFHDGFCLWDSAYTDFDVASTPYRKDWLREFCEAMRGEGLEVIMYYSIIDWDHPDYRRALKTEADKVAFRRYIDFMKNQLNELMTNYGDVLGLWFDGRWDPSYKQNPHYGIEVERFCRNIKSDIIMNCRVRAYDSVADYDSSFERRLPKDGINHPVDWECVMTQTRMCTWGWNKAAHEKGWRSAKEMVEMLVKCASNNGNFLLNVAPTTDGSLQDIEVGRLESIGDWMRINGEAIEGAHGIKGVKYPDGSYLTTKANKLFVTVVNSPVDRKIVLEKIKSAPKKVTLLKDLTYKVNCTFKDNILTIDYPQNVTDSAALVFRLEYKVDAQKDPQHFIHNELFELPKVSLALGKPAKASSFYKNDVNYGAGNVVDKSKSSRWATANGATSGWLEVDLGTVQFVNSFSLDEVGYGRVKSYTIEYKDGTEWKIAYTGRTITDGEVVKLADTISTRYVMLNIKEAAPTPTIGSFELYK